MGVPEKTTLNLGFGFSKSCLKSWYMAVRTKTNMLFWQVFYDHNFFPIQSNFFSRPLITALNFGMETGKKQPALRLCPKAA